MQSSQAHVESPIAARAASVAEAAHAVRCASESLAVEAQGQATLMSTLADAAIQLADSARATLSALETIRDDTREADRDLAATLELVDDLVPSIARLRETFDGAAAAVGDFAGAIDEIESARSSIERLAGVMEPHDRYAAKTMRASCDEIGAIVARIARGGGTAKGVTPTETPSPRDALKKLTAAYAVLHDAGTALERSVGDALVQSERARTAGELSGELATEAIAGGHRALEAAVSTQRLAYYGAELTYLSRRLHSVRTDRATLRCATLIASGNPPARAWDRFRELVEERSDGRLNVEVQLGGVTAEPEALMQLRVGDLDFVSVSSFTAASLLPLAQIFNLPFLFADARSARAVLDGELGSYVLDAFEPFGLRGLGYLENGIRHVTNNLRTVVHPSDVRRMRVRSRDSVVDLALMHALQASPKLIPFNHLHRALARGDVDAQENRLAAILRAKLYEVQQHLTLTAHSYDTQIVLANASSLNRLGDDDRAIVEDALSEVIPWHRGVADDDEREALAQLRALTDVRELSVDERNAFVQSASLVWERICRFFPPAIYDGLVNGNLEAVAREREALDRRVAPRPFAVADLTRAIDAALGAVRGALTQTATHARASVPILRGLADASATMNDAADVLAERYTTVSQRITSARDAVAVTTHTMQRLTDATRQLGYGAADSRSALDRLGSLMRRIADEIANVRDVAQHAGHEQGIPELRRIADETRDATKRIRTTLDDLSVRARSVGDTIAAGIAFAEHAARRAAAAEEALGRIDTRARHAIDRLHDAARTTAGAARRAFALRVDFDHMATLTEHRGEQSLRSLELTAALERERRALDSEGALAEPAKGDPKPT